MLTWEQTWFWHFFRPTSSFVDDSELLQVGRKGRSTSNTPAATTRRLTLGFLSNTRHLILVTTASSLCLVRRNGFLLRVAYCFPFFLFLIFRLQLLSWPPGLRDPHLIIVLGPLLYSHLRSLLFAHLNIPPLNSCPMSTSCKFLYPTGVETFYQDDTVMVTYDAADFLGEDYYMAIDCLDGVGR